MIDLGRMKVPIIEDKKGNATWSLLIDDISVSDVEVGLNYIQVFGYRLEEKIFALEVKANGESLIDFKRRQEVGDKDDYTSFIMAMSIAREYAVEQLHKAIKDEASK